MNHQSADQPAFRRSRAGVTVVVLGAVAAFLISAELGAHVAGVLSFLLLLACPLRRTLRGKLVVNGKSWVMAGISVLMLAASLSLGGCATIGGEHHAALQQKIADARTRADHEDLAGYYEQEARMLQAKAKQHELRAIAYGPPADYYRLENDFIRHCKYLASRYREAADENLALAKLHRQAAAGAKN